MFFKKSIFLKFSGFIVAGLVSLSSFSLKSMEISSDDSELSKLPNEVWVEILTRLSNKDLVRFASSSEEAYRLALGVTQQREEKMVFDSNNWGDFAKKLNDPQESPGFFKRAKEKTKKLSNVAKKSFAKLKKAKKENQDHQPVRSIEPLFTGLNVTFNFLDYREDLFSPLMKELEIFFKTKGSHVTSLSISLGKSSPGFGFDFGEDSAYYNIEPLMGLLGELPLRELFLHLSFGGAPVSVSSFRHLPKTVDSFGISIGGGISVQVRKKEGGEYEIVSPKEYLPLLSSFSVWDATSLDVSSLIKAEHSHRNLKGSVPLKRMAFYSYPKGRYPDQSVLKIEEKVQKGIDEHALCLLDQMEGLESITFGGFKLPQDRSFSTFVEKRKGPLIILERK